MWTATDEDRVGLVVLFPGAASSLWDRSKAEFVDSVEELLDGVFVTHAAAAGGPPSLVDAVAAGRFAGCTSIVVAAVGGGPEMVAGTGWALPCSVVGTARDPEAVALAYLSRVGEPASVNRCA